MTSSERFLKVTEVARKLGVCRRSVYILIEEGMLGAIKPKGMYLIPESKLEEFYEQAAERALGNSSGD